MVQASKKGKNIPKTKKPTTAKASFFSAERYGFIKDIVLIFIVLVGIEYVFLAPGTYNSLPIHPFWIAVILISSHHGTSSGLLTALVAVILMQFNGGVPVRLNEDFYQSLITQWGQPILWFIAAVFLGEMRNKTLGKFNSFRKDIDQLQLQNNTLTTYCDELQDENKNLEHHIAIQDQKSLSALLGQLDKINQIPPAQIETALPPIMENLFGVLKFSVYRPQAGKGMTQSFQFGHSHTEPGSTPDVTSQNLPDRLPTYIKYISDNPSFLSALSPSDSPILGQNALFSGPVLKKGNFLGESNGNEDIAAILSIDMLEADQIKAETLVLFQMVCQQLSHIMDHGETSHMAMPHNKNKFAVRARQKDSV